MSTHSHNTYMIDPESAAEMARLVDQDLAFNENMGALTPPEVAELLATRGGQVLDVACGPGGWAHEVARMYPLSKVIGMDISKTMIRYARAQAQVRQRKNVSFEIMDVTQPLEFADNTFDFVNARLMGGILLEHQWQGVVDEFVRITRPGGIIRLTETDADSYAITNSSSIEALKMHGWKATTATKRLTVITPRLRRWLVQAGCLNIYKQSYMLNFSFGEPAYASIKDNLTFALKLMQPFLTRGAGVSQEEVDRLYEGALHDMGSPEFYGAWYYLSVWGQKPE